MRFIKCMVLGLGLFALPLSLQAQSTSPDSIVQVTAENQGLPLVARADLQDYVRFTPSGDGSIPITLGRIDWDWAATATATPHWHITSDGVNGPAQYTDDNFPTWTKSLPV